MDHLHQLSCLPQDGSMSNDLLQEAHIIDCYKACGFLQCYTMWMIWCKIAFSLIDSTVMCLRRSWSSFHKPMRTLDPFYADSSPIAHCLLKVAVEFASANNPRHNIVMDVPADFNPEGVSILEKEIGAKPIQECIFMSDKELPTKHLSKVFGIASASVLWTPKGTITEYILFSNFSKLNKPMSWVVGHHVSFQCRFCNIAFFTLQNLS